MTLESMFKGKYTYNKDIKVVIPTILTFFDGGHSYFTQCLSDVCFKNSKESGFFLGVKNIKLWLYGL